MCGVLCSPPFVCFMCARMWGHRVLPTALPALLSATLCPALSVYQCANVGPQGLLVVRLPAPFVPHSASLGPATATQVLSAPVPVSAPPTGLDECLFFISLVSNFLAIGFSVSSGCARRCSVSTCVSTRACTSPPTQEPAPEGPNLIVGSRGSDCNPADSGASAIAPSQPLPYLQDQSSAISITPPREHLRLRS